jgi:hypothetical protein
MGRRVAVFSASQPASQPADRLSYKIFKVEYLSNQWSDLPPILNLSLWDQSKLPIMKMAFTGRRPQNIQTGISQQPPIGSSSNFRDGKLIKMKMTSNGRRPQNIKICIS